MQQPPSSEVNQQSLTDNTVVPPSDDDIIEQSPGDKTTLGDRMKAYEEQYRQFLPKHLPFVVRLDGRSFSKLTSGLHKPYDADFANVMYSVATDLLLEFTPRTVYTQSDEISLLFYPKFEEDGTLSPRYEPIFGGRVDKIVSVMAAYATARLHYHINQYEWISQRDGKKLLRGTACFDGRVFAVDKADEMAAYIVWRCAHDCVRNSISNLAHKHFSPRQIHGKNTLQLRNMLREVAPWDDMPPEYKYGVFVKREKFIKVDDAGHNITRTRAVRFTNYCRHGSGVVDMLSAVYWSPSKQTTPVIVVEGDVDEAKK